ncbi:MAG TPA: MFS transporter [Anaerolineae bacterium]|nr:MFS transporter [Anaerolineae bacterium]
MSSDSTASRQEPTTVEKLRGLPWGVAWSVSNSVFAQFTFFGSIFVLYLNPLGLDKTQIGTLMSLSPFFGVVALFVASTVARFGYKRTFILSFAARTAMAAPLLIIPTLIGQWGKGTVLVLIIVTVGTFSLFRAIGFTAFYPWLQEQVPDSLRGKYSAIKNSLASLAAMLSMAAAGYVLGTDPDLDRFVVVIAAGILFGAISVWAATRIPGGAPVHDTTGEASSYHEMVAAGKDPNLAYYLVGVSLITLATAPLVSFVPLFMKEEVRLASNQVVWLETAVLLGGLASSYLWGWLTDRYGSKPVMTSSIFLLPVLPLAWLFMPRGVTWSLYLALAIAVMQGLIYTGWSISSGRILFVRVVPVEKKTPYLALYYAWMGIAGGIAQLLGGWLVDRTAGLDVRWGILHLGSYTTLFAIGIILPLVAAGILRQVQADSSVSARQFAGMFLRGNPFLALESVVRYHRARDERAVVVMTERLGSTRSPLTVEELLGAIHDPRFPVRFEAIVSIARHGPDAQLTDALIETLEGNEPALSTMAAWALGRVGDERAVEALRRGLSARYRSVQAHCMRSLATLGDQTVRPLVVDWLEVEEDVGLQLALASAAGLLGATQSTGRLLALLHHARGEDARVEFTLALARLVGQEHGFVQLQRRVTTEPGTALSQAVTALQGRLARSPAGDADIREQLDQAALTFAQEDVPGGTELLCEAVARLPVDRLEGTCGAIVRECIARLGQYGAQRIEYVLLLLNAFECPPAADN